MNILSEYFCFFNSTTCKDHLVLK